MRHHARDHLKASLETHDSIMTFHCSYLDLYNLYLLHHSLGDLHVHSWQKRLLHPH